MPASVQVFGRRHDGPIDALLRPASEKRQGTKSQWVGHRQRSGRCESAWNKDPVFGVIGIQSDWLPIDTHARSATHLLPAFPRPISPR